MLTSFCYLVFYLRFPILNCGNIIFLKKKFTSKNLQTQTSTGMSREILQTIKLNQTFVIDRNLIDYL